MKVNLYTLIVRPVLFIYPPETAHHLTFFILRLISPFFRITLRRTSLRNDSLELMGIRFPNPVGMAAGLDKDGKAFRSLAALGFGFIELGTVTPKPQPGNLRPRLFRLKHDRALINRMGFNNEGADALARRLQHAPRDLVIGGNIGKNTLTPNEHAHLDYLYCFRALYGLVDYFVVNVSCPNVSDLKDLQDKGSLLKILETLMQERLKYDTQTPVLLKVSPDLNNDQLDDLIEVVVQTGIEGLIATNTTVTRDQLSLNRAQVDALGNGGLSGKPLKNRSLEVIRYLRKKLPDQLPIIASGCVHTAGDARVAREAGAQLVQVYTGFIYEGPSLIRKAINELQDGKKGKYARFEERKPKN